MADEYRVSFSSDEPEKRRVPKIRSIACPTHKWEALFAKPEKDKALQAEYERSEWEDYQRCSRCQRISRKRWDSCSRKGKHYTDNPQVFSLEDSLKMMSSTVLPWNDRVSKADKARPIALIFGKIVLDFASAQDQPLCNGSPQVETDPDRKAWEEPYRRLPEHLRVDHNIKERLYETARGFYHQLNNKDTE